MEGKPSEYANYKKQENLGRWPSGDNSELATDSVVSTDGFGLYVATESIAPLLLQENSARCPPGGELTVSDRFSCETRGQ
ncbi:hypothetical protein Ancab_016544 [Ancistrocladus abbreviatus]